MIIKKRGVFYGEIRNVVILMERQAMNRLNQWYSALIVSLGGGVTGVNLVWTSATQFSLTSGADGFTVDNAQFSWISGNLAIGAFLASLVTSYACDRWGRKKTAMLASAPCLLSSFLMMTAVNAEMLEMARFFMGWGVGVYMSTCPLYVNELAEDAIRGALGSLFVNQLVVWSIASYFIGISVNAFFYALFCGLLPLATSFLLIFVPESPFFYVSKGDFASAEKSLVFLRDESDVPRCLESLKTSHERIQKKSFIDVIFNVEARRAVLIGGMLITFAQLSGAEVMNFYTDQMFREAGVKLESKYGVLAVRFVSLVGDFCAIFFSDRCGRKTLLIPSCLLSCLSMTVLGVYFTVKSVDSSTVDDVGLQLIPLFALCLFTFVYSVGLGPLPFLVTPELSPPAFKSVVCSAVISWNWLLTFAVTTSFLPFVDFAGEDAVFYFFAIISLIGTVTIKYLVPETTGCPK